MYQQLASQIFKRMQGQLPSLVAEPKGRTLKVSLVCKHQGHIAPFFYEMLSRWLIPDKRTKVHLFFSTEYQGWSICEMVLGVCSPQDLSLAHHHFTFLQREILLGARSPYHAMKIREIKGLQGSEKTLLIRERLMNLVKRFPGRFGYDLFEQMQHFSVSAKQEFQEARETVALCRMITTLYWLGKKLAKAVAENPKKRHVEIKLRPLSIHTPFGMKQVFSICVALNFLKGHERFGQRHFLSALSHLIPNVMGIHSSYYASKAEGTIQTFYLEVEHDRPMALTGQGLQRLKRDLEKEISGRIGQLVPPVFMPRNEEEVMRNILLLSDQLKYIRDLPQMIISFDEQTDRDLCFTVVIVRIRTATSLPIQKLLGKSSLAKDASLERVRTVGLIRRRYPKEAAVMRVRLRPEAFLRRDFSVDLLRARRELLGHIEEIFGKVRDYNGGMIAQQTESFQRLQGALGSVAEKYPLLLENFFHRLSPVSMSTTLDASDLTILFKMLVEMVESNRERSYLTTHKGGDALFAMIKTRDHLPFEQLMEPLGSLNLSSSELCSAHLQICDTSYTGFIYLNGEKAAQERFLERVTSLTFAENLSYL